MYREANQNEKGRAIREKIYSVGFNSRGRGEAGWSCKDGHKITREYDHWRRMLQRSYDPKWKMLHPSYQECSVNPAWHDFQNFAEWYNCEAIKGDKWDLDKDLLIPGNKEYSSELCVFLPEQINKTIVLKGKVSHSRKGGYEFFCNGEYLASSKNPLQFSSLWVEAKLKRIHELANLYKKDLDPKAYSALINFKISVCSSGYVSRDYHG